MKKDYKRLSKENLRNFPIRDIVEGWCFRVDEISQGYFRVTGIDALGRIVSRDGIDPDELIIKCKNDISSITSIDTY